MLVLTYYFERYIFPPSLYACDFLNEISENNSGCCVSRFWDMVQMLPVIFDVIDCLIEKKIIWS